jgi:hypothetical protein
MLTAIRVISSYMYRQSCDVAPELHPYTYMHLHAFADHEGVWVCV